MVSSKALLLASAFAVAAFAQVDQVADAVQDAANDPNAQDQVEDAIEDSPAQDVIEDLTPSGSDAVVQIVEPAPDTPVNDDGTILVSYVGHRDGTAAVYLMSGDLDNATRIASVGDGLDVSEGEAGEVTWNLGTSCKAPCFLQFEMESAKFEEWGYTGIIVFPEDGDPQIGTGDLKELSEEGKKANEVEKTEGRGAAAGGGSSSSDGSDKKDGDTPRPENPEAEEEESSVGRTVAGVSTVVVAVFAALL